MIIRVNLHAQIVDTINCFGNLSDVTNRLIGHAMSGDFDMEVLPSFSRHGKSKCYDIDIVNEEFLELREIKGARNKNLSIRRLLYWFVDVEAWAMFGWEVKEDFSPEQTTKYIVRASKIATELIKLQKEAPSNQQHNILQAIKLVREVLNATRE